MSYNYLCPYCFTPYDRDENETCPICHNNADYANGHLAGWYAATKQNEVNNMMLGEYKRSYNDLLELNASMFAK